MCTTTQRNTDLVDTISLLLVERSKGVETKQMQCMGVWSSGTSYITFDNVKVKFGVRAQVWVRCVDVRCFRRARSLVAGPDSPTV